ncbi:MAG: A/G-specific adenine glycosylase [Alphaproteobacteria bacterium]|nr:A/G-specific adenine glycosylase [Alphaproteobacteria bacterium]
MEQLAKKLLEWYNINGRELPWRVKGKAHPDAYAVWISEIMLQQTTVKTVLDYFDRWMKRFPTLDVLATADIGEVLLMWQGLGYYTRAKKIHECAKVLMEKYNGQFPQNRDELLKLPGIGPYTASSICAFAFNMPETVVDGNVIRVIARLYGITDEINREDIYRRACALTPQKHGADYASAIMDLGATICTPTSPKCLLCPWHKECIACGCGIAEQIPLIKKPEKQKRIGTLYLIQNEQGAYYIQKRVGKGLLSGLYEFPWHYDNEPTFDGNWKDTSKTIIHVFTHFHLTLHVVKGTSNTGIRPDGAFVQPKDLKNYPFPTLMKKVIKGL